MLILNEEFVVVLTLVRRRETSLKGTKSRKRAEGAIERMLCSNRRVKSKLSRHPSATGPNRSSLGQELIMRLTMILNSMKGSIKLLYAGNDHPLICFQSIGFGTS